MEDNTQKKVDENWKEKAKTEPETQEEGSKRKFPEPDFKFFLSSLAMQAWIGLGAMPNPVTNKNESNLEQAKFIIDTLDILKEKTKGNLDKEESEFLEQILYELHLSYVNKTTAKP
ncbi:MAG: DUF1844 domain-containing protein [Candidatus Paceibacterota bacterium]